MARNRRNNALTSPKSISAQKSTPHKSKPVALTLKVDDKTYVRLCTLGATQRRTNQDILREALHDYLERVAE